MKYAIKVKKKMIDVIIVVCFLNKRRNWMEQNVSRGSVMWIDVKFKLSL